MKPLRYVYMSLEEDAERRAEFLREFPGVEWVRFPACRGGLMWGEIARGLGWLGNIRSTYGGRRIQPQWGTIGCTLSHLFCLRMATISGGIVLFPDDLVNSRRLELRELVDAAIRHRPPGAGWIKMKNHAPAYRAESHHAGGWTFRRLESAGRDDFTNKANLGSAGVIILQDQAKAILRELPPITSRGIDFELRAVMDRIPGGCWEMCGTGITVRPAAGPYKGSSRKRIDRRGPGGAR